MIAACTGALAALTLLLVEAFGWVWNVPWADLTPGRLVGIGTVAVATLVLQVAYAAYLVTSNPVRLIVVLYLPFGWVLFAVIFTVISAIGLAGDVIRLFMLVTFGDIAALALVFTAWPLLIGVGLVAGLVDTGSELDARICSAIFTAGDLAQVTQSDVAGSIWASRRLLWSFYAGGPFGEIIVDARADRHLWDLAISTPATPVFWLTRAGSFFTCLPATLAASEA